MKAIINTKEFTNALSVINKVIPTKPNRPILECFCLIGGGTELTILATNTNQSAKITIPSQEATGSIALPAFLVVPLIKSINDNEITIKTKDNTTCDILWKNGKAIVPYFSIDDFPEISFNSEQSFTLSQAELKKAINTILPSVGDDKLRAILSGVHFNCNNDKLDIVGTDSQILSVYNIDKKIDIEPFTAPKSIFELLKNYFNGEDKEIVISANTDSVFFALDNVILATKKIVGSYPNYNRLFSGENALNKATFERQSLLNSVKRVSVCANNATSFVKFAFGANLISSDITIEASDVDLQKFAKETILGADYSGNEVQIGFMSNSLIDLISSFDCENVVWYLENERKAVRIYAENDPNIKSLIMPLVINNG